MKIINKTKWKNKDLRKLCRAVIKNTGSHKNHIIYILTTKKRWRDYSGRASINGSWIQMFVPKTIDKNFVKGNDGQYRQKLTNTIFDVKRFAQILEHEIHHNLGLSNHKDMLSSGDLNVDYVKDFRVNIQEEEPKPKRDLKKERYEKALKKVKEYESKLKRYNNLLKKWKKKVRYYENCFS